MGTPSPRSCVLEISDWTEGYSGVELYDHTSDSMQFNNLALEPDPVTRVIIHQLRKRLEKKTSGKVSAMPFNQKRL